MWLEIKKILFTAVVYSIFLLFPPFAFAKEIVIEGGKIIDHDTLYQNEQLDLTQGYFEVTQNAKLELDNCVVRGALTPKKQKLIHLVKGNLVLTNNEFRVSGMTLPESPEGPSIYMAFKVLQGGVRIVGNKFTIDKPYTASLLVTGDFYTDHFYISDNRISKFHGGFILKNSHNAFFFK